MVKRLPHEWRSLRSKPPDPESRAFIDSFSNVLSLPLEAWARFPEGMLKPGPDFLMIGVAALLADHPAPAAKFTDVCATYVQTGGFEKLHEMARKWWNEIDSNTQEYLSQYLSLFQDHMEDINQRPGVLYELVAKPLMQTLQADIESIQVPEYDERVREFAAEFIRSESRDSRTAVKMMVFRVVHSELCREFSDLMTNSPVIRALYFGDSKKATRGIDRSISTKLRKQASTVAGNHGTKVRTKGQKLETIWGRARIWASVVERYGESITAAWLAGQHVPDPDPLFQGLDRPAISKACALFNRARDRRFPPGPTPIGDSLLERGRVPANRRTLRFR